MKIKKRNIIRLIWFSLVVVFFIWQWTTYQSRDLPKDIFTSNDKVSVEKSSDKITFLAKNSKNQNEIIFFQGGLTDPKAYAPLCREIAKNGFTCHLIKMNWRMPQWDYKKIETMFDLKNGTYIIGGHSQGAKMASQFVYENPDLMKGLFLLGTSHPRDFDLSKSTLPTVKLYGELDGLASVAEVMENKNKLPKNAELIEIKGANHSQFGYLGKLLTDETTEIDLYEQQRLTAEKLIKFFNKIEKQKVEQNNLSTTIKRVKFVSKYSFDQFSVNKIELNKAAIKANTNQNSFSKKYKTMIEQSFEKEPINFAGKYIINYWGCGSPCQVGVAINSKNGNIIEIPSASLGYEFRKNSRLLVLNPPDSLGYYIEDCAYCKPELYLLDTLKNAFIKLNE